MTSQSQFPLCDYKDCLKFIICETPTNDCHLRRCKKCPGIIKLKDHLQTVFFDVEASTITFKQWVNEPQCTLETITKNISEFVDYFCDQIETLLLHDFICKAQASYVKNKKESLKEGEFLIVSDFAENYAFVVQNAAQGFHWNNNQATIYPVVVYYQEEGQLKNKNYVITSDNMAHDAVAVYTFTKLIVDVLKEEFEKPYVHITASGKKIMKKKKIQKIFYVSDGAPQQFKNFKNIFNVYFHKKDFGISCEWHFFPTAHGKGPCDGIGGTAKRTAASASLQLPFDKQILTPQELHQWFLNTSRLKGITFLFSTIEDYKKNDMKLTKRFKNGSRVKDLRKQHAILPVTNGINSKIFSDATEKTLLELPKKF